MIIARSLATNHIYRRLATLVALMAIVVFPLYPLLQPNAYLAGDYVNSSWMAGYISEYLRIYHHPPNVYQTAEFLGIAFPVFYGVLFYRILGLIAFLVGPNHAIHLVLFGAVLAEVGAVYAAARAMRSSKTVAFVFCLGIACSTYQLTNLYNRGDLPEFFAFTLVTTAVAGWFWSLAASDAREIWFCRALIATALTVMAGTHAISMALGGTAFVAVSGLTLILERRRATLVTFGIALGALFIGAAITITEFILVGHQIHFAPGPYQFDFLLYTDRIDSPWARFSPFPYDPAALYNGVRNVSTPYLEAPIDYVLFAFAAAVLFLRRDFATLVCLAAALVVALISVSPRFWELAPGPFHFFQFTYRLTNYVNLLSLAAALNALRRLPDAQRRVGRSPLPWVLGTVAVLGCLIKLNHSTLFSHPDSNLRPIAYYMHLGPISSAYTNYVTMPQAGPPVPAHQDPPEIEMTTLGLPKAQSYTADRFGFIYTRILVLPWNQILVDGEPLPDALKVAWPNTPYYGVRERPGSTHLVDTYFALPKVVDGAIRLAEYAILVEIGAMFAIIAAWILSASREPRLDSIPLINN